MLALRRAHLFRPTMTTTSSTRPRRRSSAGSSGNVLNSLSPLLIDSLTRSTMPSTTLSTASASASRFLDPAHRNGGSEGAESSEKVKGRLVRSLSVSSTGSGGGRPRNGSVGSRVSVRNEGGHVGANEARLEDLSWGNRFWPFQIVEPERRASEEGVTSVELDKKPSLQGFLDLFSSDNSAVDMAGLEELQEADETPPHFLLGDQLDASPRPFPDTSTLKNPFASFALTNPFGGSSNPFSDLSNPFAATPRHARTYSTASDKGKGTKRSEMSGMLDEQDQEAAKVEDDSHMDMFSLIKERYECPKYPIVFCHGLFGFDTLALGPAAIKPLQFSYWVGIKEALEAIGVEVLIGKVPSSGSIEERATVLAGQIEKRFPGREVNLIGHSMGGLDCRYLISRIPASEKTFIVKSLTTIATPHRGSSFADFVLEDVIGLERAEGILHSVRSLGAVGGEAFAELTTKKMAEFNEVTLDDPSVKYFSYGASFKPGWTNAFRFGWGIIRDREGDNDGVVSVQSSVWGTYKATLTNVNHMDLVGWVGKVRYGWAEWLGRPIKYRPISFYCAIAEMLAEEEC